MNRAMDWIEQAVFTSAVTSRAAGYQVVARSPGVCDEDARELAVWCPSHDALLDSSPQGQSVNFHPLPSGAFCVSRTVAAGWEYSGRGGARVYTQALLVPPEVLARFANNPFALLKAALAGGRLRQYDEVPEHLEPFRLSGRATAVDRPLLDQLAKQLGPAWLASLMQAALSSPTLVVVGGPPADHVFAGMLACLPLGCRTEFSFSTGLRFSSRRPFHLVGLAPDAEELRRIQRLYNVGVLDLSGAPPSSFAPRDSWARLVEWTFRHQAQERLAQALSQRHADVALGELSALGLQLLEELDTAPPPGGAAAGASEESAVGPLPTPAAVASGVPEPSPEGLAEPKLPERLQQAHAAHTRFEKSTPVVAAPVAAPSESLATEDAPVRQMLQELDAAVFEAVAGHEAAVEQVKALWTQFRACGRQPLVGQAREAYLRYALAIWEASSGSDGVRSPKRATLSLEILCVLFDDVP